jgi:G protein-coupled receptor 64
MSVSLAFLYLTFLIGAHAAPVPALCGISAGLLQYFLLVFFGWTAVEAVYLYRNLVQVLVSQITRFVLKAGLIVWSEYACSLMINLLL